MNFGTYDPLSVTPNSATGTVTLTCTVTLLSLFDSWTITLNSGNSGTFSARSMLSGASVLSYNLYTTAAHSSVWGDGSGSTSVDGGSALLVIGPNVYTYTVYGLIPARQDVAAGSYTDTILVTVNY